MTYEEIIYKLSGLCSHSEYCCYEMQQKMENWQVDEDTQAKVIEYLINEKFIDETRYSRAFIRSKLLFNKWGKRKIEQGLYQKRIPREIYETVLEEITDEEYLEILEPLIEAKRRTVKAKNDYELKGKLIRFALGRGFEYNIIEKLDL